MNKTLLAVLLFGIVALDVIAASLVIVFAPQSFNTFATFLGTIIALAVSGTVTISQMDRLKDKVDTVVKQTNGINSVLLEAAVTGRKLEPHEVQTLKTKTELPTDNLH